MQELSYRGYRFPPAIIQHAVWLYLRSTFGFRDVEDLLAERVISVSHETIRRWVTISVRSMRIGFAPGVLEQPGDGHLDEMFVSTAGRQMYLWRAVNVEGEVLDILVQPRRDREHDA